MSGVVQKIKFNLMPPKISVIIPVAGNDPLRTRNFKHCIQCINNQTFKDYETIIVEQTIDTHFYKEFIMATGMKWVGLTDPYNRGFNLSWCRNVGAKIAAGEKIILMDADMVFEENYFQAVADDTSMFAGGSNSYHWIFQEQPTQLFDAHRNFAEIYNYGNGGPKDPVFRFEPFTKGCGYGAVLVFDRKWYWDEFGGYPEDFFKYGWEDKAAIEIIKDILNIEKDQDLSKINYPIIHLSHFAKDGRNMSINENLYYKTKNMDKKSIIKRSKELGLGNIDRPQNVLN